MGRNASLARARLSAPRHSSERTAPGVTCRQNVTGNPPARSTIVPRRSNKVICPAITLRALNPRLLRRSKMLPARSHRTRFARRWHSPAALPDFAPVSPAHAPSRLGFSQISTVLGQPNLKSGGLGEPLCGVEHSAHPSECRNSQTRRFERNHPLNREHPFLRLCRHVEWNPLSRAFHARKSSTIADFASRRPPVNARPT